MSKAWQNYDTITVLEKIKILFYVHKIPEFLENDIVGVSFEIHICNLAYAVIRRTTFSKGAHVVHNSWFTLFWCFIRMRNLHHRKQKLSKN